MRGRCPTKNDKKRHKSMRKDSGEGVRADTESLLILDVIKQQNNYSSLGPKLEEEMIKEGGKALNR